MRGAAVAAGSPLGNCVGGRPTHDGLDRRRCRRHSHLRRDCHCGRRRGRALPPTRRRQCPDAASAGAPAAVANRLTRLPSLVIDAAATTATSTAIGFSPSGRISGAASAAGALLEGGQGRWGDLEGGKGRGSFEMGGRITAAAAPAIRQRPRRAARRSHPDQLRQRRRRWWREWW